MRVLVAGVGNIFLGDDGFGVEVARRLAAVTLPPGVVAEDFGIRGVHLAYQLLEGYDVLILIDAVSRGGAPGTLYVIEPDVDAVPPRSPADAHDLHPEAVLGMVKQLGGTIGCVRIVGCDVAELDERIGLSDAVERAVPEAMRLVRQLLGSLEGGAPSPTGLTTGTSNKEA
jgi:hydrogenase maturation protease